MPQHRCLTKSLTTSSGYVKHATQQVGRNVQNAAQLWQAEDRHGCRLLREDRDDHGTESHIDFRKRVILQQTIDHIARIVGQRTQMTFRVGKYRFQGRQRVQFVPVVTQPGDAEAQRMNGKRPFHTEPESRLTTAQEAALRQNCTVKSIPCSKTDVLKAIPAAARHPFGAQFVDDGAIDVAYAALLLV